MTKKLNTQAIATRAELLSWRFRTLRKDFSELGGLWILLDKRHVVQTKQLCPSAFRIGVSLHSVFVQE